MPTLKLFDPRTVPVASVDTHLPPVDQVELAPEAIERRFARQHSWVPELTTESAFVEREPVHASVLIPLVMRDRLHVLLTQRTMHLSSHSGQIAFPGGKADAVDANATATALRETHEEVGISSEFVRVLGTLPIYTTGSAFIVTPVVALVLEPP
jgi:NUDIX domain